MQEISRKSRMNHLDLCKAERLKIDKGLFAKLMVCNNKNAIQYINSEVNISEKMTEMI